MDATQWAGLSAFGCAAGGCMTFRVPKGPFLGAINACLAAECVLGLRHSLHNRAIALLGVYYPEREPFQIALIILIGLAGLILVRLARRSRSISWRADTPTLATIAALLLFTIETVSLHAVDRLVYRPAGALLVIGWLWIVLGVTTMMSALSHHRRRSSG